MVLNDNKGAIALSQNDAYHKRTKHIDTRHHFLREAIFNKQIKVEYLCTESMVADSLTKAINGPKHEFCAKKMGLTKNI